LASFTQWFDRFSRQVEHAAGSPITFLVACISIVIWGASGPFFHWSDTWQLICNTATTIVTFLMIFLIQATQTRDTSALQLKLDELIRVNREARNRLVGIQERGTQEIEEEKEAITRLTNKE
jgi:low affinity Fe/Cu permease